jgi:hypothetical protein
MSYRPYYYIISEAQAAGATSLNTSLINGSASAVSALNPVTMNTNGDFQPIDVSSDDSLKIVGVLLATTMPSAAGSIVCNGKIENVSVGLNFGDYVYVSKAGGITNNLPEEGLFGFVAGDWVIRLGVIAKNQLNPTLKDFLVSIQIIGKL